MTPVSPKSVEGERYLQFSFADTERVKREEEDADLAEKISEQVRFPVFFNHFCFIGAFGFVGTGINEMQVEERG